MFQTSLKVLSYHKFNTFPSEYVFSRTYKQLEEDINNKDFDWITIDDGRECLPQACNILRMRNIRAKIFISSGLIGTEGYCTWDQIKELSKFHDIENHSHDHIRLNELEYNEIIKQLAACSAMIKSHTGKRPRYFVPPWNKSSNMVIAACRELGMTLVNNRIDIINTTE